MDLIKSLINEVNCRSVKIMARRWIMALSPLKWRRKLQQEIKKNKNMAVGIGTQRKWYDRLVFVIILCSLYFAAPFAGGTPNEFQISLWFHLLQKLFLSWYATTIVQTYHNCLRESLSHLSLSLCLSPIPLYLFKYISLIPCRFRVRH